NLPVQVEVRLDDNTTRDLKVTWDTGAPAFDGNTAGSYAFTGEIRLEQGLKNTAGHEATVKVIVEAKPVGDKEITAVETFTDITVPHGTNLAGVNLPAQVEVTLDDTSTKDLDVTWDNGAPAYDGNSAGT